MKGDMEPVVCELKYSGAAAAFVVASTLATATIAALVPCDVPLRAALVAWVALHAANALDRAGRVRTLCVHRDGHVRIEERNGRSQEGDLAPGGFVAHWLVCLRWRPRGARLGRVVLVMPDMLDGDAFRKLRIVLRAA